MFNNSFMPLFEQHNMTITRCGKDQTGKVNYQINNQGFRSSVDYDFVPSYAFFGSSTVFGIGVEHSKILVSQFDNAHNYGLAGKYLNIDSIKNLELFIKSKIYSPQVTIVFFWIDRLGVESIPELINHVNTFEHKNIFHIGQGQKYHNTINLMPSIDFDVSNTHPGPASHLMWAKTIKLLLNNDRSTKSFV